MIPSDAQFMRMALGLARRGLGSTWPNPSVGCVIADGPVVVGRGWTQPGGRPHAETEALRRAGVRARGATAYVTLEPCAHHGQTPPCAQALIDAGIARVVVALQDPDPRVNGGGVAMLRAAGIQVETGVQAAQAAEIAAGFLSKVVTGRPFVTLKLASSFDGRIATATGESRWITGPLARRRVHHMRARHDAVLVGAGTARADDPSLTVRDLGHHRQPVRLVISRRLDLPLTGTLARTAQDIPVWLCCGPDVDPGLQSAWEGLGARVFVVPLGPGGQVDVCAMLKAVGEAGLTRVFCEGGAVLAAALLGADCVDALVGFTAGVAIGAEGWPALGAMGIDRLATAPRFSLVQTEEIGGDVLQVWERR